MVPCNPVDFLKMQYGDDAWQVPQKSGFTYHNREYFRDWTDAEWPNALKLFNHDKININKTLEYLNKFNSNNFKIKEIDINNI